jgi:hypothetical protein
LWTYCCWKDNIFAGFSIWREGFGLMGSWANRLTASPVFLKNSILLVVFSRGFTVRRRFFRTLLALTAFLAAAGCALFGGPPTGEELVRDFQGRVNNEKDKAFVWVESSRKGKGDYDLLVTMREGWFTKKNREKRADALAVARTWVRLIQPLKPEESWVEFVDSKGSVLAWGLFQNKRGLFLGLGKGRSKGENASAKGSF